MSSFFLKLLAGVFLLLGHIYTFIDGMPEWFRFVGILAMPIFLFCSVEGFYYTRSRKKYLDRLLWGAIILLIGTHIFEWMLKIKMPLNENLFFTLVLGVILMNSIEFIRSSNGSGESILMLVGTVIISIFFEYSFIPICLVLIFYFFRQRKRLMAATYSIFILVVTLIVNFEGIINCGIGYLLSNPNWMMILSIIPILMYKGKKGVKSKIAKYGFYVLYPVHIWILYLLGCLWN